MHRWLLTLLLGTIFAMTVPVGAASAAVVQPVYVRTIGSGPGADPGQLRWPRGMAVNEAAGLLYVAESGNNRVQKFSTGTGLPQGYLGAGTGEFSSPQDVALDRYGYLYVADTLNSRIRKFSPDGGPILEWKPTENGVDELLFPLLQGIAVGGDGAVYAVVLAPAQPGGNHIFKLAPDGHLLQAWGPLGTGDAQVTRPRGIAVGPSGDVYVIDSWNHRVQRFSAEGVPLARWSASGTAGDTETGGDSFSYPWGIEVDPRGNVYVADTNNHRVLMFRGNGELVTQWGGERGTGPGQFNMPWAIAADSYGDVYVTDAAHRIQEFTFSSSAAIGNVTVLLQDARLAVGITQALQAKLDSAYAARGDETVANDGAGAGALQAFINLVDAQRGKLIPADVADGLTAAARAAMSLVGVW